jgi:hypothetical protein
LKQSKQAAMGTATAGLGVDRQAWLPISPRAGAGKTHNRGDQG